MIYLLNATEINGHKYTANDIKGVKQIYDYNLDTDFYGGRVAKVGLTDEGLLLMLDGMMQIIDIGAEDPALLPIEGIRHILNSRKIKYHHKAGKEKLIELLEGREVEDE